MRAIDADELKEQIKNGLGIKSFENLLPAEKYIVEKIDRMPTIQPEQHIDEWCTNCKEYDHENHCCHRFTKVIRQTRRELQDEFVMTAVDGTLWVTVDDVQKVGRVIVDEDKSKFCRQFYMDAQPQRTGKWIKKHRHYGGFRSYTGFDAMGEQHTITVDERTEYDDLYCSECGARSADNFLNFCPNCGAEMEGASNETD